MKTKSTKKRQAIIEAAAQLFRELGYERTSMTDILARVGGSRATLYNHFPSKEALFLETAFAPIEKQIHAVYGVLDGPLDDVPATLTTFGMQVLAFAYTPDVMAARRLTFSEANRFTIGPSGFKKGYLPSLQGIADFLERAMQAGKLRPDDPLVAAQQLSALLEAELLQRLLYYVISEDEDLDIAAKAKRGVDAFLRIYAPEDSATQVSGFNISQARAAN